MGNSKGSNTTTSTSTPNPQAEAAYANILQRAGQVGRLPYTAYGGEGVAGINPEQYTGIGGVNNYSGYAQPFINMAAGYETTAADPNYVLNNTQKYMDPFTNQVVNATEADFANMNAQQRQGVVGNAISQGAFGGNREAIAESELAHQQASAQDPIISGLRTTGYNTGLNTALTEQQNLQNAGYGMANLGVTGQQAGESGAAAQIGAGSMEQQTQQALDQYLYGQFQNQQAFPYQQAAWLAGIDTGVGSNMGGTSTTTGPPPSLFGQILGAGAVGAGLYGASRGQSSGQPQQAQQATAKYGGGIKGYDDGGEVTPYGGDSFIPSVNITHGSGAPKPPKLPSSGGSGSGLSDLGGLSNLGSMIGKGISGLGDAAYSGVSALGEVFPEVGAALADAAPFAMLALRRGGQVPHGYDDGGGVSSMPYGGGGISPTPYGGARSWIPAGMNITKGSGIPKPPAAHVDDTKQQMKDIQTIANGLISNNNQPKSQLPAPMATSDSIFRSSPAGTTFSPTNSDPNMPSTGIAPTQIGDNYGQFRRGGYVHGYAAGGDPENRQPDPYDDVGVGSYSGIHDYGADGSTNIPELQGPGIMAHEPLGPVPNVNWSKASPLLSDYPAGMNSLGTAGIEPLHNEYIESGSPLPRYNPSKDYDNPDHGDEGIHPVPIDTGTRSGFGAGPTKVRTAYADEEQVPTVKPSGIFSGIDLSSNSKLWPSLMSAGFGMLASRSPFAGVAIGEGGQQGLGTYSGLVEQERKQKLNDVEVTRHAKELQQKADEFDRNLAEKQKENRLGLSKPIELKGPYGQSSYVTRDENGKLYNLDGSPYDAKQASQEQANTNLQGEEYIKTLPVGDQPQVRQAGQYLATIPSANSRSPDAQRLRSEIFHAYPELDERTYGLQSSAARKFYSGTDGDTVKSFNVSIAHLDTLQKAANALQNGDYPLFNKLSNYYKQQTGQSPPTDFNSVRDIVADEIVKAIVGSRAGVTEREEAHKRIDRDFAQGQFDSVIGKYKELMTGQLNGLRQKFVSSTGLPPEAFERFLLPETKQQLLSHVDQPTGPAKGERKQFKQGWGVWDGTKWVPAEAP